jgi:hypothetical protein
MQKLLCFIFGLVLATPFFAAASVQVQQQSKIEEENFKSEDFTKLLKDEWSFLKDATDEYLASVSMKTEFETSKEFADRAAKLKSAYVNKVSGHLKEKKLDRRTFNVLFKTTLVKFDADLLQYRIACSGTVEAPYDIPSLHCIVPTNPYVILSDSVNRGFRTSSLRIRFAPSYRWKVNRDEARVAKNEEPGIYFKIQFVIDMSQEDMVKQAHLRIIPKRITMVNDGSHKIYWTEELK